jgi:hypothetical protein
VAEFGLDFVGTGARLSRLQYSSAGRCIHLFFSSFKRGHSSLVLFFFEFETLEFNCAFFVSGQPPTCMISASPTAGSVPLTVHFTSSGSTVFTLSTFSLFTVNGVYEFSLSFSQQGLGPLKMEWDFNFDGQIDSTSHSNVTYVYTTAGNYIARLIVKDRYMSVACSVSIRQAKRKN